MRHGRILGAFCLYAVLYVPSVFGATIYVKASASGSNNGSSWTNAYTRLDTALGVCTSSDEIWVAAATYTPDDCNPSCDRTSCFNLVNGCDVYGGFAGTETLRTQRNPSTHVTILSGDNLGNDPTVSDNAHTVVCAGSGVVAGSNTILDGFTITAGHNDQGVSYSSGGGMYCVGSLTIDHMAFVDNYSDWEGAGIFLSGTTTVIHTYFTDNTLGPYGFGGAVFIGSSGNDTLSNCLFTGNGGGIAGGAIYVNYGTLRVENCTATENFDDATNGQGGEGLYNSSGAVTIVNSIFWNNGGEIANSSCTVTYSDVQGGYTGTGNINCTPSFGVTYHPASNSCVVDVGSNAAVNTATDLAKVTRIQHTTVDMGCFEYPYDDLN